MDQTGLCAHFKRTRICNQGWNIEIRGETGGKVKDCLPIVSELQHPLSILEPSSGRQRVLYKVHQIKNSVKRSRVGLKSGLGAHLFKDLQIHVLEPPISQHRKERASEAFRSSKQQTILKVSMDAGLSELPFSSMLASLPRTQRQ